jgi:hypothetical protein
VPRALASTCVLLLLSCVLAVSGGAAGAAPQLVHFKSPSGNINCMLGNGGGAAYASCLVRHATWRVLPRKPASCDLDFQPTELEISGRNLIVGSCRGDIGPLCEPSGPDSCHTLAYGRSVTLGPIRCTSAVIGVTCRRTDGRHIGFRIAREGYLLYR